MVWGISGCSGSCKPGWRGDLELGNLHLEHTGFENENQEYNGAKYGWVRMGGQLEKVLAEL
jgi:hypothetical protein